MLVEAQPDAPIQISPRPSPLVSKCFAMSGSARSASRVMPVRSAVALVTHMPWNAATPFGFILTVPLDFTNLSCRLVWLGSQTSGCTCMLPESIASKMTGLVPFWSSTSRPRLSSRTTLRMLAVAATDGQLGTPMTTSAAWTGADATPADSRAAQRVRRQVGVFIAFSFGSVGDGHAGRSRMATGAARPLLTSWVSASPPIRPRPFKTFRRQDAPSPGSVEVSRNGAIRPDGAGRVHPRTLAGSRRISTNTGCGRPCRRPMAVNAATGRVGAPCRARGGRPRRRPIAVNASGSGPMPKARGRAPPESGSRCRRVRQSRRRERR